MTVGGVISKHGRWLFAAAALTLSAGALSRRTGSGPGLASAKPAFVKTGLPRFVSEVPLHRSVVAAPPVHEGPPEDPALIALGREIFDDPRFSDPPGTSCASCHDPHRAFSGTNGATIGVPKGSRPDHFARRATPSLLYLKYVPKFHFHDDDEAAAPAAIGGFFWDGRTDTIAELVEQPLFNPDEMNARSESRVAAKLRDAPYAAELRAKFGSDAQDLVRGLGVAIEAYLTSDEMAPATSKYDRYLRGEATLTALEKRGLEAFKDPSRGACAGCHRMNESSPNPKWSMFTDYGFDAVAAPRNRDLPANRNPAYFDLGLCERKDPKTPSSDDSWCGSFRTPSLRNVAVRRSFMHNGVFRNLRDVVVFYATRAATPGRWYQDGTKFDDLPEKHRANVNVSSAPYNRREDGPPAFGDEDVDAIVAFLGTLTDATYLGNE
ncbi:MAG TPA: cytochrome c peroxidase [Polyangiaceae bacterium]|nr:cytochrome c peroxidase [Polyangiaceae bacterium]